MRKHFCLPARVAALLVLHLVSTHSWSQTTQSTTETAPIVTQKISDIIVIGNPLEARDVVAPVTSLSGTNLLLKRASTLGETLSGEPGVSATWFGPNASRPVIRGLDGDRIRILNNQGGSFDASSLSPDHAVALDPLVIERIEVLRGPASLLYGGSAVGGVVNVVDNRVPRSAIDGIGGAIETRIGGAEKERGTSAVLEAGQNNFSVHADGFRRETKDYRVPDGTGTPSPIVNSASESSGGALGASYQFAKGYIGTAQSQTRSAYGTVVAPTVRIDMQQNRSTYEAAFGKLSGPIKGVFAKASQSDYQHTETDEGTPQTTFKNKGGDFRLEIRHDSIGDVQGVFGVQLERFEFSALGAEAFVPLTHTRNAALFGLQELTTGAWGFSLGARAEKSRVRSDGAANTGAARFGRAAIRAFNTGSASASATYKLDPHYALTGSLAYTERAPTFYELFADGPHGATGAYESGNPQFNKERSASIEGALRWKRDQSSARIGVFVQQFRDFMLLRRSGRDRDSDGNGVGNGVSNCGDDTSVESGCLAELLPEFQYKAVSARLSGVEAEAKWRLATQAYALDAEAKLDFVRADDRTNHSPLPRVAPMRLKGGIIWTKAAFGARLEVQKVFKQNRYSFDDALGTTNGYTLLNVAATHAIQFGRLSGTLFLKGANLADRKAFNAVSIDTIRNLAPLPGRSVKAGILINF